MEEAIMIIKLCQIGVNILALVGIFWLGYIIGQEKVYKEILKKSADKTTIVYNDKKFF